MEKIIEWPEKEESGSDSVFEDHFSSKIKDYTTPIVGLVYKNENIDQRPDLNFYCSQRSRMQQRNHSTWPEMPLKMIRKM